jgi:hypothetical protein
MALSAKCRPKAAIFLKNPADMQTFGVPDYL